MTVASKVDPDALLCALILAPRTFPRNRYFALYEDAVARRVRRRASRVRGVIRQLVAGGHDQAEVTGEQVLGDGRLLIRYRIEKLSLHRTIAMSALEAAALHYAMHRAGIGPLGSEDRKLVERALERLGADLEAPSTAQRGRRPRG